MEDTTSKHSDWDPKSMDVQRNQLQAYDEMRERCPVAWSEFLNWSLFRHEDVLRVLLDHETFSNAVSNHLSVPNAMDPPEHTPYRKMIEHYFSPSVMEMFAPKCREITEELISEACKNHTVEIMQDIAYPFAARVQCSFLSWPRSLCGALISWVKRNHQATFAQDRHALSKLAVEFENIIDDQVDSRRQDRFESEPDQDLTCAIMNERVWDRSITNEEISSILRNWTVGEIGTISSSIGILMEFFARHGEIQEHLRSEPALLPAAIDEILRIYGPLVSNRRIATRDIEIGGRQIKKGEKITLMWMAANRDPAVFNNPDTFRLDRDSANNLLYGAGVHVCPGAPLARLELQIFMECILAHTSSIQMNKEHDAIYATYPASGYSRLSMILH